jgi:hypothetical protein
LGHLNPAHTYYYLSAAPELLAHAAGMLDAAKRLSDDRDRPHASGVLSDRLTRQLHASRRTIASYRDTLRLLLCFAQQQTGTTLSALDWDQLDEPLIAAFLDHLESERHNSARTRNLRLTAIRSLFSYAALRHPEHTGHRPRAHDPCQAL